LELLDALQSLTMSLRSFSAEAFGAGGGGGGGVGVVGGFVIGGVVVGGVHGGVLLCWEMGSRHHCVGEFEGKKYSLLSIIK
jgi:hypothetical protein